MFSTFFKDIVGVISKINDVDEGDGTPKRRLEITDIENKVSKNIVSFYSK